MTVEGLTPAQIREIASRYQLKVSGTSGTTSQAVGVYLLSLLLMAGLSIIGGELVGTIFHITSFPYYEMLMLAIFVSLNAATIPMFYVLTPKYSSYLVSDMLTGRLHPLTPGKLNIKLPWHWATRKDFIDVRALVVEGKSRFVIRGGKPGKPEGAIGITFGWTVQYGGFIPLLPLYVRTEPKAISDGFGEIVENALSEGLLAPGITAEVILQKNTLDGMQNSLNVALVQDLDETGSTIEQRNGLKVELNTLGPPEFDKDYTEALAGQVSRGIMTSDAQKMAKKLKISGGEAMQNVMIINKEAVNRNIHRVELDDRAERTAGAIGELLNVGREAVRGVQTFRRRRSRQGGPQTPPAGNQEGS